MSRKAMDSGKASLILRFLMYFRIGLYNTLLSMSQSSVIDHYGRGDDSEIHLDLNDVYDRDEIE